MKIAIEKFWCVKYYKAQPYNMEHTLCVCVWFNPLCMSFWNWIYKICWMIHCKMNITIRIKKMLCVYSHTHTVCVPYYKAAPYNISHTKNFSMAIFTLIFFYKFFFMYVYHAWKMGLILACNGHLIMVISGQFEMVINWGYILKSCSTYNFYVF